MLVKVNETNRTEQGDWNDLMTTNTLIPIVPVDTYDYSKAVDIQSATVKIADIKNIPWEWTIAVNIQGYGTGAYNSATWRYTIHFYYQINNGDLVWVSDTIYYRNDKTSSFEISVSKWDIVSIYAQNEASGYPNRFGLEDLSVTWPTTWQIILSKDWDISWYATKLTSIWQQELITFFWSFWWEFLNWIKDIQECIDLIKSPTRTTTATTWSITLWQCVWYIVIWDYKIPYYK